MPRNLKGLAGTYRFRYGKLTRNVKDAFLGNKVTGARAYQQG
jgi:hypothetical protein